MLRTVLVEETGRKIVKTSIQLGNYALEVIQMTLESAWIYEIHYFPLNLCPFIVKNENYDNYIFLGNFAHFGH